MNSPSSHDEGSAIDALRVLAATASVASDRLREEDERSRSSSQGQSGSASNGRLQANSRSSPRAEDDDARSRASTGSAGSGAGRRTGLRKGKWTVEEEEYATRFIHHHSTGLLPLPAGQTLRSALAARLACDPMRITKKYAGASCLGNKISRLCGGDRPPFAPGDAAAARAEMERLERRFRLRVERGPGVPLPEEEPVVSTSPVSSPAVPLPSSNATANSAASQVHSTTSVASAAIAPAAAAPAPSVASYLAALASNAQLAAAQFRQSSPAASVASTVATAARAPAMPVAAPAAPVVTGWPAALPHAAPVPPVATPVANNDRLVQTLLLQITAQLQALAALSPSTLRQIQLQILAGTLSASPPPAPAVPVGAEATALLASFQLAAAGQLPAAAPTQAQVQAAAAVQLPTAAPIAGPPPTGLSALLAANATAGLQHLLPLAAPVPHAQGLAALAATNVVAGSPTGSQPAAKEPTPVPAQPVPQAGLRRHEPAKKRRISVQEAGHRPPVHAPVRTAAPPGAVAPAAHPMAAFLAKLRQGHAEAVERARREQEADSAAASTKAKKPTTNPTTNGTRPLVALLPFEHATTVSSGSGTTHEGSASGSASSIEALGASDGTRGADGSADSGASSSSDDGNDPSGKARRSVPPRKRYREGGRDNGVETESFSKRLRRELSAREEGRDNDGGGGGMTRRNLANHDVRMRMAEMNGGSGY